MTAEKLKNTDKARHYYWELIRLYGESAYAARARDRQETALVVPGVGVTPPSTQARYAVSVGLFSNIGEAEKQAKMFSEAGHRVHYLLRGTRCELLVGELASERAAQLFAQELAKRYQIKAVPRQLP